LEKQSTTNFDLILNQ